MGGFALGAYWAGWRFEEHYFSEVDPWAVELYQKRFPDAIPLGDIREIDCETLADTDTSRLQEREGKDAKRTREDGWPELTGGVTKWIITGGFQCQDISVAGKGEDAL